MGRRRGSKTGGFEPATLSLAVLSAVTGVSGYGASVMNKDQQKNIDEAVAKQVAAIQDKVAKLADTEAKLSAETSAKDLLNKEVASLKAAIENLKKEKESKEGQLKSVQMDEILFRGASTTQLKKAFDIVQAALPKSEQTDTVFKSFSTLPIRRGTLGNVVAKLTGPSGKSAEELRTMFIDALQKAPEEVKKDITTAADAKSAEAAEKSRVLEEEKAKKLVDSTEKRRILEEEKAKKVADAAEKKRILEEEKAKSAITPVRGKKSPRAARLVGQVPIDKPEDYTMTQNPIVKQSPVPELEAAAPLRSSVKPTTFTDNEGKVEIAPSATRKRGGMRKKKLRTRRGVKQNVRRSRNRKNRANRSD